MQLLEFCLSAFQVFVIKHKHICSSHVDFRVEKKNEFEKGVCFLKMEKTVIEARVADFTLVHIVAAYI